ncbi:MAG: helix-turn-helix domain-containing protein [Candidatus Nomurabacteria bacterium]|nr:MAG: helix-turn-helix domain-containing protein [Candidatus Nomurabacteria bacterium]
MDTEYLTVEQVANLLQVHWQSVLNYIKRGDLPAMRLGRGYRIARNDLDKFIEQRTTRGSSR